MHMRRCHTYTRPYCHPHEYGYRRAYRSRAKSIDGQWSPAIEVAAGESEHYELYSLVPWRHPDWAAGLYLAVGSYYDNTDKVCSE